MGSPENAIDRVADELAVRRLLDEYCLRLEVNTFDEWLDLFADDAIYEVHRRTLKGRAEIAAMLSKAPHGLHLSGPVRIELLPDGAKTVRNYLFINSESREWVMGWYYFDLTRTNAGWKISHAIVKFQK